MRQLKHWLISLLFLLASQLVAQTGENTSSTERHSAQITRNDVEETKWDRENIKTTHHYRFNHDFYSKMGLSEDTISDLLLEDLENDPELRLTENLLNFKTEVDPTLSGTLQPTVIVNIPDPVLEQVIRNVLNIPSRAITSGDMATLISLVVANQDIHDLTGLEYADNLKKLRIDYAGVSDLTPISNLVKLEYLVFWENKISDIMPVANLTRLELVSLSWNNITDISPLQNLTQLWYLGMGYNQVESLAALQNLTRIQQMFLQNNQINDITPLQNITSLQRLQIYNNQIADISALRNLSRLYELQIFENQISDISVLQHLGNIQQFYIDDNPVSDLTPLANLPELRIVGLNGTNVSDLTALQTLPRLKKLFLENTLAADFSPLSTITTLEYLNLRSLKINDILFLSPLTNLKWLWLYNNLLDNADLPALYGKYIEMLELTANPGVNSGTAVAELANHLPRINCEQIYWDGTCGVDPLVEFRDPNLEQAVSNVLAVPVGQINVFNILELQTLNANNLNISDLTGLEYASNLVTLELNQNQIDKIETLKNLTALNSLSLAGNLLANEDLESLKKLKNLRYLNLQNNPKITSGTQMQSLAENFTYLTCEQILWDGTCGIDPNSAPVPNFLSVNPNPVLEQQILTLTASATDAENHPVQINVDWGDGNSSGYSALFASDTPIDFTHEYAQPGNFNLKLIARDAPGLESEWSAPQMITVNGRNKAPVATILEISPIPVEAEQTVQLQARATDEDNDRVQMRVDWGDGEVTDFSGLKVSGEVFQFTHIFQAAGNYEIKVNARDEPGLAGPWSAAQTLAVKKKNTAPVAIIKNVEPEEAEINERVSVRAEALDLEGDQVRLRIDWGDGERSNYSEFKPSGTTFEFSHLYSRAGDFKITAIAEDERDLRGKWSPYEQVTIVAPNTGPTALITQMTPQIAETGQTITVIATAIDPQQDRVQMKINWGDEIVSEFSPLQASGSVFTFTHVYAVPGNYTVKVLGGDEHGAVGNWSEPQYVTVQVPHTPLTASIVSIFPLTPEINQEILVQATAVDQSERPVQLKIDWGDENISEYSELKPSGSIFVFRHAYPETGDFPVKVRGRDETGLEGAWSGSQIVVIKPANQPPVAAIESLVPNPVETGQRVTARFTANDPEKNPFQLKIDWGDGRISDFTEFRPCGSAFEFTPSYPNPGSYVIRVLACDEAGHEGNWSEGDTLVVIPPNSRPNATISSITPNPVVVGDSVALRLNASDSDGDSVQCRIDWGDGTLSGFSPFNSSGSILQFSHLYTTIGSFPVKAQVCDQRGLEGSWSTPVNLIVKNPNQPPVAYIKSLSPMSTTVNSPINLSVAAADSNHDRVQVQVDWGDGNLSGYSAFQAENTAASFSHIYSSTGTFSIKVRGKDENEAEGEWSAPMNVTIREVNVAPVAQIDSLSANPLLLGQPLHVRASATDLNSNDQVQICLDWGDGTFSEFSTPRTSGASTIFTKIYSVAGEFQLKVIARDAAGLEGNWSAPRRLQVFRPNTAPRDSIVSISPKPVAPNAEVTVQARAWDAEKDPVQMKINWGDGNESPYASSQASGSLFSFIHRYTAVGEYPISITTKDPAGLESNGSRGKISVQATGSVENSLNQVFEYALWQNYPNPFNNSTVIEFSLKESGPVEVQIFDPTGKEVRQLVSTLHERGVHQMVWDATDNSGNSVSSGLYFYRLKSKNQVLTKKLIFLK